MTTPAESITPQLGEVLKHLRAQEIGFGIDYEACQPIDVHVGKHLGKKGFARTFDLEEFDQIAAWMLESARRLQADELPPSDARRAQQQR